MKKRILLSALMVFLCFSFAHAAQLTQMQKHVLKNAYKYGSQIHFRNQTYGETLASIVYQESKAGAKTYQRNGLIVGDRTRRGHFKSLGPMQVQLPAARDVERWYPSIFHGYFGSYSPTDEELIVALLTDIDFNIQIGAAYFKKMIHIKKNWSQAILAYNRGAYNDGTDPNQYVRKVKMWRLKIIKPFLEKS